MKHASAIAMLGLCVAIGAARADEPAQTIYKYKNASGRVVYTNNLEQVPLKQREAGRVDLSHVSLNPELADAIAAQNADAARSSEVATKHAELAGSSYCRALKDDAAIPLAKRIWRDHTPLVVCGAIALLLLFLTPRMVRDFGAPEWAKVLMKAIPALALAGGVMYGMMQANRTVSQVKNKLAPCLSETFAKLGETPEGLAQRERLVEKLQSDIQSMKQTATDKAGEFIKLATD